MEKEKRSALVQVLFTPSERVVLEKLATSEKMKLGEYIRLLLRQTAKDANVWPVEDKKREKQAA